MYISQNSLLFEIEYRTVLVVFLKNNAALSVYSDENTLIYELGSKYIDYEWLIIKLDNGIVIDYDFGLT